ncbi:MAG: hypothetical protein QXI12_13350, partial [Candidatus Methanomethyliaceae archaeon]
QGIGDAGGRMGKREGGARKAWTKLGMKAGCSFVFFFLEIIFKAEVNFCETPQQGKNNFPTPQVY